ncbi:MAG: hypothetical protein AVDCRST_MAG93-203, partial [uncultured Chloroflexia bacterium]
MPVEHESAGLREPRFPVCNAG